MPFQPAKPHLTSPVARFFRGFSLIIILAGVIYLFWQHYDRSLDIIQSRHAIQDQTDSLDKRERQAILQLAEELQDKYGLQLQVRIAEERLPAPPHDPQTIFIGLVPSKKQAVVELPVLLEKALDKSYTNNLKYRHFKRFWAENQWKQGLSMALGTLKEQLHHLEQNNE